MMKSVYLQEDLLNLAEYLHDNGFEGTSILITGATGLIGSLCVKAIIEHNKMHRNAIQVIALVRSKDKVRNIYAEELNETGTVDNINFIYQNITEEIRTDIHCDYIIHTANSTSSSYYMTHPVEVMDSIYTGTKMVLNYGLQKHVKGIVYLSSMEIYGVVENAEKISEETLGYIDIQNIRNCYSEGKRMAELLCKSFAEEYGLNIRIARLAQTFGAGISKSENRVFAQFARSAIKGENIVLHTAGKSMGNYCYTTDAIKAILLLLNTGMNGNAYNIVNEETTRPILEVAELVSNTFSEGKSKIIFDIPANNKYGYASDTKMILDSNKIKRLGWSPDIDLKEMFKRMIDDI